MVHAEKIVTALARGTVNTRWRDFVDVVALAESFPVESTSLIEAVRRVADHRGIGLRPLAEVLDGYGETAQARWAAWRRKQQLEDRTPESFHDLLVDFVAFADPVLDGKAAGNWLASKRAWG